MLLGGDWIWYQGRFVMSLSVVVAALNLVDNYISSGSGDLVYSSDMITYPKDLDHAVTLFA
jgi:hypothetical protein